MAVSKDEIIEAIKEMPALQLAELVKEFEEIFGVSAAAPMAVAAAPAAGEAAAAEEKDSFDVMLTNVGANKISKAKTKLEEAGATVELK
jgi:large subunit ribosomal protein L7/L12